MKKISKSEAEKEIIDFFKDLNNKSPKEIKKIKTLAMHNHISLRNYKRLFCKKCFQVFNSKNSKVRIKKGFKTILCINCNKIMMFKIK